MINSFTKNFVFFSLIFTSFSASAAGNYLGGKLTYIASTRGGLTIKLDSGVPGNCGGARSMIIAKEDSVMISVALAAWASGNREIIAYTDVLASDVDALSGKLIKEADQGNSY